MAEHLARVHDVEGILAESFGELVDACSLESDFVCYAESFGVSSCSRDDVRAEVDGGDVP